MKLEPMLRAFGRPASFISKDGEKLAEMNAFISPLRYKNKMYLYGVNTEIGYNSQGHYLYIGPPDHDVSKLGDEQWIESNTQKFTVDRSEKVYFKNEVVYIWAIIREIVEVD